MREVPNAGSTSGITFGFRGEDVIYQEQDRAIRIAFTWGRGPRLYPESIAKWSDGIALTTQEKRRVFTEVLRFIVRDEPVLTVVVNVDDPSRQLWEEASHAAREGSVAVEYTSDQEEHARERAMFLSTLQAGKGLSIDGLEIRDERTLDRVLDARRHLRGR